MNREDTEVMLDLLEGSSPLIRKCMDLLYLWQHLAKGGKPEILQEVANHLRLYGVIWTRMLPHPLSPHQVNTAGPYYDGLVYYLRNLEWVRSIHIPLEMRGSDWWLHALVPEPEALPYLSRVFHEHGADFTPELGSSFAKDLATYEDAVRGVLQEMPESMTHGTTEKFVRLCWNVDAFHARANGRAGQLGTIYGHSCMHYRTTDRTSMTMIAVPELFQTPELLAIRKVCISLGNLEQQFHHDLNFRRKSNE